MDLVSRLLLVGSIAASLGGLAAFIWLFVPRFNIYWLILAPVIMVCYQFPAALLYGAYKRRRGIGCGEELREDQPPAPTEDAETGSEDEPDSQG